MSPTRRLVEDADLFAGIADPERRQSAGERVLVDGLTLSTGDRLDATSLAKRRGLGVLVMYGFLTREIKVAERTSADLIGPGDLLCPAHWAPADVLFSYAVSWTALDMTGLALLDEAFCARVAPWPEIICALVERARRPGDRAVLRRAITRSATVEVRLLMSLWHWASSWGAVTADGVRLAVPLSHERLARLIDASRPTVTTAIGRLRKAGYIRQSRNGQWVLLNPSNGVVQADDTGPLVDAAWLRRPPKLADKARIRGPWDVRELTGLELYTRLAEQRELLRSAADRHAAQLLELQDRSEKLRATVESSGFVLQRRGRADRSEGGEPEAVRPR